MKTANELSTEYWNKPPSDRINTTVQDYVFDYQQEIIDGLKNNLENKYAEAKKYFNQVLNRQDQISKLQEQGDAAIKHLDSIDNCLKTYGSEKAKRILKGEADD